MEGLEPTAAKKRAEKINYGRLQKEFLILYYTWILGLKGKVLEKLRGFLKLPENSTEGAILAELADNCKLVGKKDRVPVAHSIRHIMELFDVDVHNSCKPNIDYCNGDMLSLMRVMPMNVVTFGWLGHDKQARSLMDFLERKLRHQRDCPNLVTAESENCKDIYDLNIECLQASIAQAIKSLRKEACMDVKKVAELSLLIGEYNKVRDEYAKAHGKGEGAKRLTETQRILADCSGEKYAEKRAKVEEVVLYMLDEIFAENLEFKWEDRLKWLHEGVVVKGKKRSWEQLRTESRDVYVGLTRLNRLKVGEVMAALRSAGVETDKKLKKDLVAVLRVHKFEKHLEKLAEEYAEGERLRETAVMFTRAMASKRGGNK
ncbi:hypothetical protein TrCOL_g8327 [Triparma columacea]|uniref:Uncharacterized protein n=1 Tax=Triparma columacea TaxID=722753 RepID=A0A9W7G3S1_9STRA|nr:hypothetical protein TrCOL_g8327 [Triparma columacea]